MATDNNEKEQKIVTKKHIDKLEKENRQKKILVTSLVSIVVVVVLLIVYGVLSKTVILQHRAVAKVNDEKITVTEFQHRVSYERFSLEQTYINYYSSGLGQFLQSYLLQIQNQLDSYLEFGQSVLENMITEKLIVQNAKELGLSVSEEEISKELEQNFGFYADGTPTPAATVEYRATSTYSPTQVALMPPTATPTEIPTEAVAETPLATSEGDETAADESVEATATPTATEVPPTSTPSVEPTATEILPTATPFTREGYETLYSTVVANLTDNTNFSNEEFRDYVRTILYKQKLYEYLTKDAEAEQDMVWARHILVSSEEDAQTVLDKLNSGEDFYTVAAEYSLDTSNSSNGGDLGWIYKGQMVEEFEAAAWELGIGEISEPVYTQFGYHIIQVLGHEVRQLSADEMSSYKSTIYQKYIADLQEKATTETYSLWASVVPSSPSIPTEYRISQ